MAYSPAPQVTPGEFVDENDWNRLVDNITFLANPPRCHLTRTPDQTIPHLTVTNVLWTTETYDSDAMHSTSVNTDRITIKTAGIYVVTANIMWGADTDWLFAASFIQLNGTTNLAQDLIGTMTDGAIGPGNSLSVQRSFAVNDYLTVAVYEKNTSAGTNIVRTESSFAACMIAQL